MTTYHAYPPAPAPADPLVFTHIDPAVQAELESRGWEFTEPAMSTRCIRYEVIRGITHQMICSGCPSGWCDGCVPAYPEDYD